MERSTHDWKKTIGKQRLRGNKASPYAYLKFSLMNCISISILFYVLFLFLLSKPYNHLNLPDWDLQDDHSLLQADNLRGINPYSRKVYYLDDPVHLLVSCAELWQRVEITIVRTKLLAPLKITISCHQPTWEGWNFVLACHMVHEIVISTAPTTWYASL